MTGGRPSEDAARFGVIWGMFWGPAAGMWLLAPPLLESHRLFPISLVQWLAVLSPLLVLFVVAGALLGLISAPFLGLAEVVSRRRIAHARWVYALVVGPAIAAAYLADSLLGYWVSFGSLPNSEQAGTWVTSAFFISVTLLSFGLAGRWVGARRERPPLTWLVLLLGLATASGMATLPLRVSGGPAAPAPQAQVVSCHPSRPVVLIGLDSGTWRVIDPLLQRGDLPTLKRLLDTGVRGNVDALWPPYWSAPAWGTILTGYGRDETGVFEDMAGRAPGLPTFQVPFEFDPLLNPLAGVRSLLDTAGMVEFTKPPRKLLGRRPFWELLDDAGVPTGVVRFRFTYPAASRAGVMVSDWIGQDKWNLMLKADPLVSEGLVAPPEMARQLSAPFAGADPPEESLFKELLGGPAGEKPGDAKVHPADVLRIGSDIDRRTFDVSETILRLRPDLAVFAVYLGGFDTAAHAFWQYRFPEDFPGAEPAAADVEALGPVLDRYMQFVDRRIGRLLTRFETPPNVMLVSDHGHTGVKHSALWRGWHSAQGVFLAGGPDIQGKTEPLEVSYFDIVPTLLSLAGCSVPAGLAGSPLLDSSTAASAP